MVFMSGTFPETTERLSDWEPLKQSPDESRQVALWEVIRVRWASPGGNRVPGSLFDLTELDPTPEEMTMRCSLDPAVNLSQ